MSHHPFSFSWWDVFGPRGNYGEMQPPYYWVQQKRHLSELWKTDTDITAPGFAISLGVILFVTVCCGQLWSLQGLVDFVRNKRELPPWSLQQDQHSNRRWGYHACAWVTTNSLLIVCCTQRKEGFTMKSIRDGWALLHSLHHDTGL